MREYISPGSISATVRMLRSTFAGSFLLVEGDVDARFLKRFVDKAECYVQSCGNRSSVVRVVAILDGSGFVGHLGVIDRDYSGFLNEVIASENIVMADENDLELMMFQSDSFERFIEEYGNSDRIAAIENSRKAGLRDIVIGSASIIGTLRLLSKRNGWNLKFDGMTLRFLEGSLDVDLERQVEHLRGRSMPTSMPRIEEVKQLASEARDQYPDLIDHTCGHDVCEIIAKGIRSVFGRAHVSLGRGGKAVEEVLRAAFTVGNFQNSSLFAQIRAWEAKRAPLRVLPA